jgi:hypothetical protein
MMKSWSGFALVVGTAGLMACGSGSPADGGSTDAASDIVATDTTPASCDGGVQVLDSGSCVGYVARSCDGRPFCPAQIMNDAIRPNFRITQIDVQRPASLQPQRPIGRVLNTAIAKGTFFWGISIDLMANTIRTGTLAQGPMDEPGYGLLRATFRYTMGGAPAGDAGLSPNRWDPVMGTLTVTGNTFSTNEIALITVPVYSDDGLGTLLAELPLRNARMHDVRMSQDRGCIGLAGLTRLGGTYSTCLAGQWNTTDEMMVPYGVLEADLTVEDARRVYVESLMNNLCFFIAGSDCSMPPSMWTNPPDVRVGGATENNAWHLVANFSAVAARIE